jgi:hypothetical protein
MLTAKQRKYYRTALAYFEQRHGKGKVATDTAFREFWAWYVMRGGTADKQDVKQELGLEVRE